MAVVLKLRVGEEVRRVYLENTATVEELTFASVSKVISEAWPELTAGYTTKYADDEGDMCTMTETTFGDFRALAAAAAAASNKQPLVLRLEIAAKTAAPTTDKNASKNVDGTEMPDPTALLGGLAGFMQKVFAGQGAANSEDDLAGLGCFMQKLLAQAGGNAAAEDAAEQLHNIKGMFKGLFKGKGKGKGKCMGKGKDDHEHPECSDWGCKWEDMGAHFAAWHQVKQGFLTLSQLNAEGRLTETALVAAAVAALPHVVQLASQHPQKADRKLKKLARRHPELMKEIISVMSRTPSMKEAADAVEALLASEDDADTEGSVALQVLTSVHAMNFGSQVEFLSLLAATVSEPLKKALEKKEGHCKWWLDWHRQHHSMEHSRVTCDGCGAAPIQGLRFKCNGHNFDLCSECYLKKDSIQCPGHEFTCIPWSSGHDHWKGMHWAKAKGKGKCWMAAAGKAKGKGACCEPHAQGADAAPAPCNPSSDSPKSSKSTGSEEGWNVLS